jgi:predicted SAM-dependent methyltransferase
MGRETTGAALRRSYYSGRLPSSLVAVLPGAFRRQLQLELVPTRDRRLVEIGSGGRPQPGYLHVDSSRLSQHAEFFAKAWDLPFPDCWENEILAIHVLEHIPPRLLAATLVEWRRVLRPGGKVCVHVPDSAALMRAYLASPPERKWNLIGALLGMYANSDVLRPEELSEIPDHHVLFDAGLLADVLADAGFVDFVDRSQDESDVHTEGWLSVVSQISLIAEASKPVAADEA